MLAERIHLEGDLLHPSGRMTTCSSRSMRDARIGAERRIFHQLVADLLRQDDRQNAVLEAVAVENIGKAGAMTQRMPKSSSAQGACSREEPQPKLSPATRISACGSAAG